jgi:hypothetical protein
MSRLDDGPCPRAQPDALGARPAGGDCAPSTLHAGGERVTTHAPHELERAVTKKEPQRKPQGAGV